MSEEESCEEKDSNPVYSDTFSYRFNGGHTI